MGINLGALIAPIIIGILTDDIFSTKDAAGKIISYGYKYGFLAAAAGMFLGQISYNMLAKKYLGDLGLKPQGKIDKNDMKNETNTNAPLTKNEKQRVTVIFIYFFFAIFFFAGFEQAGSSLTLYTDKFIDRNVNLPSIGGYVIPTSLFQSINPFFIVLLAPIFAYFWNTKLGQKLTTPLKMGLGMVILGVGFFFMLGAVAERGGDISDVTIKASIWWVILTYLVHTIGELCLSPVGLSVVTKLAPPKLASLLMGVWLMASFFANILGGYLAFIIQTLGAGKIFLYISIFVIICGILMIALNKVLVRMMQGVR